MRTIDNSIENIIDKISKNAIGNWYDNYTTLVIIIWVTCYDMQMWSTMNGAYNIPVNRKHLWKEFDTFPVFSEIPYVEIDIWIKINQYKFQKCYIRIILLFRICSMSH